MRQFQFPAGRLQRPLDRCHTEDLRLRAGSSLPDVEILEEFPKARIKRNLKPCLRLEPLHAERGLCQIEVPPVELRRLRFPEPGQTQEFRKVRAVLGVVGESLVSDEGDDFLELLVRRRWARLLPDLLPLVGSRHEWRLGNDLVGHGQGEELPDVLPRAC